MKQQIKILSRWTELLWRGLADWRLTVVLLIWLALVAALAALLPDIPSLSDDPLVMSQWLADMPAWFWPIVTWLHATGIFPLQDSLLLRLPLVVLLCNSLVALAFWLPPAWRRFAATRTAGTAPSDDDEIMRGFGSIFSAADLRDDLPAATTPALEGQGFRLAADEETGAMDAWRRQGVWLALPGLYFGLALAVLGLILSGWLGWVGDVSLQAEAAETFGPGAVYRLALEEVDSGSQSDLPGSAVGADVSLSSASGISHRVWLPARQGRLAGPAWLVLTEVLPAAELSARQVGTGEPILMQPLASETAPTREIRLPLNAEQAVVFAGIPAKGLTVAVERAGATDRGQRVTLSFFRGVETSPARTLVVSDEDEILFDDTRLQIQLNYDVVMRASLGLWWLLVVGGWGMLVVSLLLLTLFPPGRLLRRTDDKREYWVVEGRTGESGALVGVDTVSVPAGWKVEDFLRFGLALLTAAAAASSLVAWWTQAQLSAGGGTWVMAVWLLALAAWLWTTRQRRSALAAGE